MAFGLVQKHEAISIWWDVQPVTFVYSIFLNRAYQIKRAFNEGLCCFGFSKLPSRDLTSQTLSDRT